MRCGRCRRVVHPDLAHDDHTDDCTRDVEDWTCRCDLRVCAACCRNCRRERAA